MSMVTDSDTEETAPVSSYVRVDHHNTGKEQVKAETSAII